MQNHLSMYVLDTRPDLSKVYNPSNILHLLTAFDVNWRISAIDTVNLDIEDRWIYPINLNNHYRISRSLSAVKGAGIVYYDAIDAGIHRCLLESDGHIILDHIREGFFVNEQFLEGLHEGLNEAGLPPEKIWLINGNMLSELTYCDWLKRKNISMGINMIPFHGCYWLLASHNWGQKKAQLRNRIHSDSKKVLGGERRGKSFVSFNGRLRSHRLQVVLFLYGMGIFEKGHISFLAYGSRGEGNLSELQKMASGMPFAEELLSTIPGLMNKLPLALDVPTFDYHIDKKTYKEDMPWSSPDPSFYLDSYFSVVVDTCFYESMMLFLTPIIYKSIMNCHPFVYFGPAGALAELRRMGFKTFAPFIDESYDKLLDSHERMRLALVETQRLANMPKSELHKMYCELWPVLEYNFDLFWHGSAQRFGDAMQNAIWGRMGLNLLP